jgi:hypothetical protein
MGAFQAGGRLVHDVGLRNGAFAYPFVRNLVRTELLDAGYYTRSQRFRVQPACERITSLDQASSAAIRWWAQRQATEPNLCASLVAMRTRVHPPHRRRWMTN